MARDTVSEDEKVESAPKTRSAAECEFEAWQVRYLDPAHVRFFERGDARIHVGEPDRTHLDVRVRWCFPQSEPTRYLSICNRRDEEIGVLREPGQLDGESKRHMQRALEKQYFVPRITRMLEVTERGHVLYCTVETDRGPRQFAVNDLRQNVSNPEANRYVIQDVRGNRYEIADLSQLDTKSQEHAASFV